jgi:hypothetical protein
MSDEASFLHLVHDQMALDDGVQKSSFCCAGSRGVVGPFGIASQRLRGELWRAFQS